MQDFIVMKRRKGWRLDGGKHFLSAVKIMAIFLLSCTSGLSAPAPTVSLGKCLAQESDLAEYVLGSFNLCSFLAVSDWQRCCGHCGGVIGQLKKTATKKSVNS